MNLLPLLYFCSVLRKSILGRIIIMSYILLIILYIMFVVAAGASMADSDAFCVAIAVFFHYLTITYLFWMFAEVFFYCLRLSRDFGGHGYTRRYFLITSIVCCGE